VAFSGFKDKDAPEYKSLVKQAESLGASVSSEPEWNESVTHVVSIPASRTMKVFAGLVTGKWLMKTDWITASHSVNHWLPEADFGYKKEVPYKGKKFFLSPDLGVKIKNLQPLLDLGGGITVDSVDAADFVIEKDEKKGTLTYNSFLSIITQGIPGYEEIESKDEKKEPEHKPPARKPNTKNTSKTRGRKKK